MEAVRAERRKALRRKQAIRDEILRRAAARPSAPYRAAERIGDIHVASLVERERVQSHGADGRGEDCGVSMERIEAQHLRAAEVDHQEFVGVGMKMDAE